MANIHIVTYGCAVNQADSEAMAGLLREAGYEVVGDPKSADLVVINSCTVKNSAEAKLFKDINDFRKLNKKIVVAGCVAEAQPDYVENKLKELSVVGPHRIKEIVDVVQQTLDGNTVVLLKKEDSSNRLSIPKIRKNKIIEIIPINEGCLGSCSYCKTKQARGQLLSYPVEEIKKTLICALEEGCKEIWLTSQDTAVYGVDNKTNIIELLKELVKVEGDFKIRLGMGNPDYFIKYADGLIEVLNSPKLFKFLHIPFQAGNDLVLKAMRRNYNSSEYKELISKLRDAHPDLTVATDVICGFPLESEEQFEESIGVVEETKPDILNVSRFWARPGTDAAEMPLHFGDETKERAIKMQKSFDPVALSNNKKWLGWKGEVLIDEVGKNDTFIGRNYAYKQVIVKGDYELGSKVDVVIKSVSEYDLKGF
ncbi:tRNA (N(6)-L-threonylcarbamoyladenosine(37)-C(2))-methylthiotransferase [Nanoarchaeota archaeon]